jgi:hypothetical protein
MNIDKNPKKIPSASARGNVRGAHAAHQEEIATYRSKCDEDDCRKADAGTLLRKMGAA